jgi:hypothetical protein
LSNNLIDALICSVHHVCNVSNIFGIHVSLEIFQCLRWCVEKKLVNIDVLQVPARMDTAGGASISVILVEIPEVVEKTRFSWCGNHPVSVADRLKF